MYPISSSSTVSLYLPPYHSSHLQPHLPSHITSHRIFCHITNHISNHITTTSPPTPAGGVLDVCWGGVGVYAVCGADAAVSVHTLGRHDATVWMRGHTKAVNAIRWNPQKTMLASASDDTTINVCLVDGGDGMMWVVLEVKRIIVL